MNTEQGHRFGKRSSEEITCSIEELRKCWWNSSSSVKESTIDLSSRNSRQQSAAAGQSPGKDSADKNLTTGTTILEAVKKTVDPNTEVIYNINPTTDYFKANNFSHVIVAVGETPHAEPKGDNLNLTIPEGGSDTIQKVCIVVIVSGRPLTRQQYTSQLDALEAAWLPGTEGEGVTDVLLGEYGFTEKLERTRFKTQEKDG